MEDYINLKMFFTIFSQDKYRKKLDYIILDFFGLNPKIVTDENLNKSEIPTLEFVVLYENTFLFKINVKDINGLFKSSKTFYLNFSSVIKKRPYELIMPCYWNIYFKYQSSNLLKEKKLVQFAKFFTINNPNELKVFLTNLKLFNIEEINDIINMVIIK